jgi:hypothetical protein
MRETHNLCRVIKNPPKHPQTAYIREQSTYFFTRKVNFHKKAIILVHVTLPKN